MIASALKAGGLVLNETPLPGAWRAVWNREGTQPVPAAIIIPGEGEQEKEERVSRVEGAAEVGRRPDRRETDGGGPWAAEAGCAQGL